MNLIMFTQKLDREASVQGFAHEWIARLSDHLEQLFVITNELGDYHLPDSVTVRSLRAEDNVSRPTKVLLLWSALREFYRKAEIHGAFVHQIELYGLVALPQLKLHGTPIVQFKAHKGVPLTLKLASYVFDGFVTSSEDGLELRTPRKWVIGQGINTDRFRPGEGEGTSGEFRISSIGRISPVKDYETLFYALQEYRGRGPDDDSVNVRLVGGPGTPEQRQYKAKLVSLVEELGIEDWVEFVPPKPNEAIPEEYRRADLFVNLSHTGSLDKAVLEAMACECPVVTSNWAYREVFPESIKQKCLIEPGDVETLADRIEYFRDIKGSGEDRELREALREIVVSEHNLDRFLERLVDVFRKLQSR